MDQKQTSIEKALHILLAFTPTNQETGTVEIAHRLGYHKATVSRILTNLTRSGFIQQNPQTKKFRLGPSALELGRAVKQSVHGNHIIHLAKPYIDGLRDRIQDTVALEVLSDKKVIMGYIAEGLGPIRIKGNVGESRPAYASAGAKAILAFSSPETRKVLLMGEMVSFTPQTITDPQIFEKQLKKIKKQGFAFDNEEVNLGINALAAPVFNYGGEPVAAVAIAGLSKGITWESGSPLVSLIKEAAGEISKQLYFKDKDL